MEMEMINNNASIIKVIGVGGGGCNAVNHMFKKGIKDVEFYICNTDKQALNISPVPNKICLGESLTEGRGAGSNPEVGRNAAIESIDTIEAILKENTKMVFITAGLGGGTGTGAAPIIAKTAKEMGILTVGIVTMPFSFEGKKRIAYAEEGLREMRENVDTLLVINNNKIREVYGNLRFTDAFSRADDILCNAAKSIAEIITVPGYVNVDFEDVKTVTKNGGTAIMGTGMASGENRAIEAITMALDSPLLDDNDISGAGSILLYILSGSGDYELTMDEIAEITDYITEKAGDNANIIWGNGFDDHLEDKLSVTVIATGFNHQHNFKETAEQNIKVKTLNDTPDTINKTEKTTVVSIDEDVEIPEIESPRISDNTDNAPETGFSTSPVKNISNDESFIEKSMQRNKEDLVKSHKPGTQEEVNNKMRELLNKINRSKSYNKIEEFEKVSAFKRQKNTTIPASGFDISNMNVDADGGDNKPSISERNKFITGKSNVD